MKFNWVIALAAALSLSLPIAPAAAPAKPRNQLATNASLSVEAIKLQSQSEKLLTLEQEQRAARKRESDFAMQGRVIGAGLGAGLGAAAACGFKAAQGRKCDKGDMIAGGIGGGLIGQEIGGRKGEGVAKKQNLAAERENEMKRRLQIASKQLDTARTARKYAEAVAVKNQRKLAKLKAEVKAGRASKQQLAIARADAIADAQQVKAASTAMGSGAASLSNASKQKAKSQSAADKNLGNAQASMVAEAKKTDAQYNALVKAINQSAL